MDRKETEKKKKLKSVIKNERKLRRAKRREGKQIQSLQTDVHDRKVASHKSSERLQRPIPMPHAHISSMRAPEQSGASWELAHKAARGFIPLVFGSEWGRAYDLATALYKAVSNMRHEHDELLVAPAGLSITAFQTRLCGFLEMSGLLDPTQVKAINWNDLGPKTVLDWLYKIYSNSEKDGLSARERWEAVISFLDKIVQTYQTVKVSGDLATHQFGAIEPIDDDKKRSWAPWYGGPSSTEDSGTVKGPYAARVGKAAPYGPRYVEKTNGGHVSYSRDPSTAYGVFAPSGGAAGSGAPVAVPASGDLSPMHPSIIERVETDFGPGIRITGRQVLCNAGESAAGAGTTSLFGNQVVGADIFATTPAAPAAEGNILKISPDTLNLRLGTIAQLYSRWRWVDGHVMYTPSVATSQQGNFVMGFSQDVGIGNAQTLTYASVTQLDHSLVQQWWAPTTLHLPGGEDDEFLFVESVSGAGSQVTADRQTCHGLVVGFPNIAGGVGWNYGLFWICYDIILADPAPSYGLAATYRLKKMIGDDSLAILVKYLLANPLLVLKILGECGIDSKPLSPTEEVVVQTLKRLGLYHSDDTLDKGLLESFARAYPPK